MARDDVELTPAWEVKVVGMAYTGGIIGIFSHPRDKLQATLRRHYQAGWRLRSVLPPKVSLGDHLVEVLLLLLTLLLYAPRPGETLIFEREA